MTYRPVGKRKGGAIAVEIEPLEDRRLLSATLALHNPDGVPSDNRLVFNRIQIVNPAVNDIVHDTDVLEIQNTGNQPLVLSHLTLSDTTDWQLVNPPAAGTSIAAGGTLNVTVKFIAQSAPPNQPTNETNDVVSTDGLAPSQTGGVWDGTLTIASNDPANPTTTVQLAGYWQYESEHEEEPNLQTIVNDLFGYDTVISNTQQPDYANNGATPVYYGDEVASAYWQAADPSQAVTVTQLAAYHNQTAADDTSNDLSQAFSWYAQGNSGTLHTLFNQKPRESQSLLPDSETGGLDQGSFTTSGVFGFNLDGEYSQDSLNTTDISMGRSGHAVRFFPLIDANGNVVANSWIVAMDYQNSSFDNSDFQDGVYLVTNARPVTQAPAPTNLSAVAAATNVTLQWSAVTDANLQGYNVYRASSAGGTFTKLNSSPISTTSYTDASPLSGTSYYKVSAVDSAGESQKVSTSVTFTGQASDGADLQISAVALTGKFSTAVVGGTRSKPTRVTVVNYGNQTAKGTVEVDLYLSTSPNSVSTTAPEVAHVTRNINLKAGKSVNLGAGAFLFPSDLDGQEFLVAQVIAAKGITETDAGNNLGALASSIAITPPFVDLANLFTGQLPATFAPGKRTSLVLPLINNGNIVAKGVATVTVAFSTSSSGSNPTSPVTLRVPLHVNPGKTQKYNLHLLVPTLGSGTYYVVTSVQLASDTTTLNNTAVSTGTFTV